MDLAVALRHLTFYGVGGAFSSRDFGVEIGRCSIPTPILEQLLKRHMLVFTTSNIFATTVPLLTQCLNGSRIICRDIIGNILNFGFLKVDIGINKYMVVHGTE